MAIGTQDYFPSVIANECLAAYCVAFTTNNATDPTETTFYGGHINDITYVDTGVYKITLNSATYIQKVLGASGMMLESADPSGTPDNDATFHTVNCYVDEAATGGCEIYVVVRAADDQAVDNTTGRRVLVTLHVLLQAPTYKYS